jgi:hypothetical protein
MGNLAGLRALNFNSSFIDELKKHLLLLDKIGIAGLSIFLEDSSSRSERKWYCDELRFLEESQLIFNVDISIAISTEEFAGNPLSQTPEYLRSYTKRLEFFKYIINKNIDEVSDSMIRVKSYMLNNLEEEKGDLFFIPLVKKLTLPDSSIAQKAEVVNLVIEKFPYPNGTISWEQLLEFKHNPDNVGRLTGVRVWMNKFEGSSLTINEVRDELDYHLYKYEKALTAARIKYQVGIFEGLIIGGAGLLENTLKLNFSKIAKGIFSAKVSKANIIEADLKAPGHELSYIYKANEKFKNR